MVESIKVKKEVFVWLKGMKFWNVEGEKEN